MAEFSYIARVRTDFPQKFGVPRQSGLIEALTGTIVFEPEYRNPDMLRGLEGFTYIWLIWAFSQSKGWSPTVRPPRLGGNQRMGVFATRSPFRPNPIGLSSVKLDQIELHTEDGPVIHVSGVDLMDGTPVLDIKPYIPYADSHPEAASGFLAPLQERLLTVECSEERLEIVPERARKALLEVLAHDPRPAYQRDPDRVYGMDFAGVNVKFRVEEDRVIVCEIGRSEGTR
jgi:tRNA-Thr(GGU) m(6)t(6)A37 methyltransferase TsaA